MEQVFSAIGAMIAWFAAYGQTVALDLAIGVGIVFAALVIGHGIASYRSERKVDRYEE